MAESAMCKWDRGGGAVAWMGRTLVGYTLFLTQLALSSRCTRYSFAPLAHTAERWSLIHTHPFAPAMCPTSMGISVWPVCKRLLSPRSLMQFDKLVFEERSGWVIAGLLTQLSPHEGESSCKEPRHGGVGSHPLKSIIRHVKILILSYF